MIPEQNSVGGVSAPTNAKANPLRRRIYPQGALVRNNILEAKRRLPLRELMRVLGDGEQAKKSSKCPFHDDTRNSFSVFEFDGQWFWKCHPGCGQGDGVDYLKAKLNLTTGDAIRRYCELAGLKGDGI